MHPYTCTLGSVASCRLCVHWEAQHHENLLMTDPLFRYFKTSCQIYQTLIKEQKNNAQEIRVLCSDIGHRAQLEKKILTQKQYSILENMGIVGTMFFYFFVVALGNSRAGNRDSQNTRKRQTQQHNKTCFTVERGYLVPNFSFTSFLPPDRL